jgi:hypothetical protein
MIQLQQAPVFSVTKSNKLLRSTGSVLNTKQQRLQPSLYNLQELGTSLIQERGSQNIVQLPLKKTLQILQNQLHSSVLNAFRQVSLLWVWEGLPYSKTKSKKVMLSRDLSDKV